MSGTAQRFDPTHRFADRESAGRALGRALQELALPPGVLVLALPRGGVPVAAEAARLLQAPLDLLLVRKVGLPWQPELAVGAIASGGIVVQDPQGAELMRDSHASFEQLVQRERAELERREHDYRRGAPAPQLKDRTVVLVDDGLATGATMLAAVRAARAAGAAHVIAAAPVASSDAVARLRAAADQIEVLQVPAAFFAVGEWYECFEQVSDQQVRELLAASAPHTPAT